MTSCRTTGLILFLSLVIGVAASVSQFSWAEGRDSAGAFVFGGLRRTFLIHVPPLQGPHQPVPLVLALHGGGGNARRMVNLTQGGFNRLADRDGFIVVYPDGVRHVWNDGRESLSPDQKEIDDVGFLCALIDTIAARFPVDAHRVYATGISNGSQMSARLAFEASGRFAAVGLVAHSMLESAARWPPPAHPVSVLIMTGTDDPLVPWNGGVRSLLGLKELDSVLPVRKTVEYWVGLDGCAQNPIVRVEPDTDPADKTRVRTEFFSGGREGTEVVFEMIQGGGHTWPGGMQYLPTRLVGRTCRDINACDVIWAFFQGHRRN